MMRTIRIFTVIWAFILMLATTGCTHNNGDIGPLFGQWKVLSIVADGTESPTYDGDIFWSFQSHTIEIKQLKPDHESVLGFGNWSLQGHDLRLDFPDADRIPPEASLIPAECVLQTIHLDTSKAIFLLTLQDGGTLTFTLKKW